MTTAAAAPSKTVVALKWLDNPIIIWGGGALLVTAGFYLILPSIYGGAKKGAKTVFTDAQAGFSAVVDNTQSNVSSIIGSPTTQQSEKRDSNDIVQGLFTPTDRALSDWYDKAASFF